LVLSSEFLSLCSFWSASLLSFSLVSTSNSCLVCDSASVASLTRLSSSLCRWLTAIYMLSLFLPSLFGSSFCLRYSPWAPLYSSISWSFLSPLWLIYSVRSWVFSSSFSIETSFSAICLCISEIIY
jgi:hypothetical protein